MRDWHFALLMLVAMVSIILADYAFIPDGFTRFVVAFFSH